jgi:hypothetical protein
LLEAPFVKTKLLGFKLAKSNLAGVGRCFSYSFFLTIYFYFRVLIRYLILLASPSKIIYLNLYVFNPVIAYSS